MLVSRWFLALTLAPAIAASLWAVSLGPSPAPGQPWSEPARCSREVRPADVRSGPRLVPRPRPADALEADPPPGSDPLETHGAAPGAGGLLPGGDGWTVQGQVVGPGGEPLADVALTLGFALGGWARGAAVGRPARLRSDAEGRWRVDVPAEARVLELACRAPDGYLAPGRVRVRPGGRVEDAPWLARGPRVEALRSTQDRWSPLVVHLDRRACVSGRVAVPLHLATWPVCVSARWSRPLASDGVASVRAVGGLFSLEVPASAGPITVCARLGAEAGSPGAEAAAPSLFDDLSGPLAVLLPAELLDAPLPAQAGARSDDDRGPADPTPPPPAPSAGYAPVWTRAFPAWAEGVTPGTADLRLTLAPAFRAPLSILDADGRPARVHTACVVGGAAMLPVRVVGEPQRAPGEWMLLSATREPAELVATSGTAVGRAALGQGPVQAGRLTLTLGVACVRGQLLGVARPSGWRVRYSPAPGPPPGVYVCGRSPMARDRRASPDACAAVADDGTFCVEVEPGTRGTLWATCFVDPVRYAVTHGVRAGAQDVALQVEEGGALRGLVRGLPALDPHAGRLVARREGLEIAAVLGADGAFCLEGLAPGPWSLALEVGGRSVALGLAEPRLEPVELALPEAAGRTDPR